MRNNFKRFIDKYWRWLIFLILCFSSLSFLIFQNGLWGYIDALYLLKDQNTFLNYIEHSRLFEARSSAFGYDSSFFVSRMMSVEVGDFLRIFGYNIGIIFLYLLFIGVNFFSSYSLLSCILPKKSSFLGALFFSFNPVAIFFFNKPGFIFAYSSAPLVLVSFMRFFYAEKGNKFFWLAISPIGFYSMLSYTRIAGIYGIFIVVVALIYWRYILYLIVNKKKEMAIYIGVNILVLSHIIFPIVYFYLKDYKYSLGISNYIQISENFSKNLYNSIIEKTFFNNFYLQEISDNFAVTFKRSEIFKISSFLFSGIIILHSLFLIKEGNRKNKNFIKDKIAILMLCMLFISIGILGLSYFMGLNLFEKIAYSIFPFIAGNEKWICMIFLLALAYLISWVHFYQNAIRKNIVFFMTVMYCFLSLYPLIDYNNNIKLKTISFDNIPNVYKETFFSDFDKKIKPSLFFPTSSKNNNTILFSWAPYPLDITYNNPFIPLFGNNPRVVSAKQAFLSDSLNSPGSNLGNAKIFNLKDVFLFKDVVNDDFGFDFFSDADYVGQSKFFYEKLKNDENFNAILDDNHLAHFVRSGSDNFDFFIYSPTDIINTEPDVFFKSFLINENSRPVIFDSKSFNNPNDLIQNNFSGDVEIFAKSSALNPTKNYLKIENFNPAEPFVIQLNQSFGPDWKLRWVEKSYFDEKSCESAQLYYDVTNNSTCQYKSNMFELNDIRLFLKSFVKEEHHFEGNFVGNAWMVTPDDIPENMRGQKELYAVLIYEKQIYYSYALLISMTTMCVLIILAFLQEINLYKKRKLNEKPLKKHDSRKN